MKLIYFSLSGDNGEKKRGEAREVGVGGYLAHG